MIANSESRAASEGAPAQMFAQFRRVFADLWRSDQQLERSAEPAAPARDNEIVHPMLLRVHLRWADFAIPGHASSYAAEVTPN
jgi:hypothetical protein